MVKLGKTTVVAGVTGTVSHPLPGAPDAGSLDVSVQVLPLISGSGFAAGLAQRAELKRVGLPDAACLAEFLRKNILSFVDLEALCVEEGHLVWALYLTVYCIDFDGCIEDAILLASWAALRDVRLPALRLIEDPGELDDSEDQDELMERNGRTSSDESVLAVASIDRTEPLTINDFCLSVSFALLGEHILPDPCGEEEAAADARLTLVMRPNGELRGVHKPGGRAMPIESFGTCIELAQARIRDLVARLGSPLKQG
jgi:exosome complex RNA-binding protein Rrp42 (RNase PH superfamily)